MCVCVFFVFMSGLQYKLFCWASAERELYSALSWVTYYFFEWLAAGKFFFLLAWYFMNLLVLLKIPSQRVAIDAVLLCAFRLLPSFDILPVHIDAVNSQLVFDCYHEFFSHCMYIYVRTNNSLLSASSMSDVLQKKSPAAYALRCCFLTLFRKLALNRLFRISCETYVVLLADL